jgi:hypothetical protein
MRRPRGRLGEPQELGLHLHSDPSMALHRRTVNVQAFMEFATDIWTCRLVSRLFPSGLLKDCRWRERPDSGLLRRDQTSSRASVGYRTARCDAPRRSVVGYQASRKVQCPGTVGCQSVGIENGAVVTVSS